MEKLDKRLKKFSPKELKEIERLAEKILRQEFSGLDLKKLKIYRNFFRVRKRRIRIIFRLQKGEEPFILAIERRSKDTYKW